MAKRFGFAEVRLRANHAAHQGRPFGRLRADMETPPDRSLNVGNTCLRVVMDRAKRLAFLHYVALFFVENQSDSGIDHVVFFLAAAT